MLPARVVRTLTFLMLACAAVPVAAQQTGSIQGKVTDIGVNSTCISRNDVNPKT
jgi:hypothetical protein